jgi:imidazoleglycerol phosphate dehydratase HisB
MALCYKGSVGYGCEPNEARSLQLALESSGKGSRYGQHALGLLHANGQGGLAMDDAQIACAMDLSARPYLICNLDFPTPKIGSFDSALVREFFQALSTHGGITLHIDKKHGFNSHHIAEAAFKAVAKSLRMAVEKDPRNDALPSTKGTL